ncbi:ATP-binding protein [Deinococcus cellulosilyticus]|uniref:Uncharacterized protein n=1 Tax=Deinococcus cellulosilyticus (strain DSM 18568 / NBRC 106333 / KACC 11606 / 5516J-15) TaxID=1223518 RepID=A0A511N7M4_DEIC1|nr:hypothetical protein [Deinococcus cellulosilyticus]GEM48466.1 hypothetical protein DC3_41010 [Deinococcus cellulosilyticus NBRC 106333 = KACC 11606]
MHVQTLGALEAGIKPIKPKNLLLLCYLALEGKQDRKHLQMLFWPEAADPATSLRVALSYLQGLGKDLFRSVQNQVESLIHTDAQELTQFYQQQQYSEVIKLYSGAFLKGLDLKNSSTELEDWIFETREKLASLVQWSVLYEAQKVRYSMPDQFQALAEQFFQIDGAPPPTLEMLRFLYTLGLEGYLEHRVLKEAAELGVDLTTLQVPQKTNLQTAIRPVQVFVGRDQELQLLHERLQQIPPAIVTITGLGGVGKSTLVRAYCAEHHPEDTLWLKADGLKDASGLLHQLGLNVQQADPWVGLTDTLRYHKGIVVIDGADQLSGLDHLQNWLRFPDLRVIVTCRQPLQLPEESLLKLEPFSIQEYRGMGLSEVMNHPAVQCFEKHAKRNHAAFKIRPEDAQDVVHLCAALSGLPLALEMASSWTQILSLKEIREEVQQVVDPEGDPQSLKPIFEASWNLLSEQEKQALTNLNCFLGSFTREAAVIVSGVQLRTLQQLVRKSMLQMEPGQRFRVPPVLRGFIPDAPAEVGQKYQEYHLHLLDTMDATPGQQLMEFAGAIPDLMEIIRRILHSSTVKTLPLLKMFDTSGFYHIGLQFYSDIIRSIKIIEFPDIFIEYAWLCFRIGINSEAIRICEMLDDHDMDREVLMKVYNIKASVAMAVCNYRVSEEYYMKAFSLAILVGDKGRVFLYGINYCLILSENDKNNLAKDIMEKLEKRLDKLNLYQDLYINYVKNIILFRIDDDRRYILYMDQISEEARNNEFMDIYLHAVCKKYEFMFDISSFADDSNDLLYAMGIAQINNNISMYNSLKVVQVINNLDQNYDLFELIYRMRSSRDRYSLALLLCFIASFKEMVHHDFLKKVIDYPFMSTYRWERLKKRLADSEGSAPENQLFEKSYMKVLLEAVEWMVFKDHQQEWVGDRQHHPHPEATEVLHLLEPHPTSPERSL